MPDSPTIHGDDDVSGMYRNPNTRTVEERYQWALRQIALGADLDAATGDESSPRLTRRAMQRLANEVIEAVAEERKFKAAVADYVQATKETTWAPPNSRSPMPGKAWKAGEID